MMIVVLVMMVGLVWLQNIKVVNMGPTNATQILDQIVNQKQEYELVTKNKKIQRDSRLQINQPIGIQLDKIHLHKNYYMNATISINPNQSKGLLKGLIKLDEQELNRKKQEEMDRIKKQKQEEMDRIRKQKEEEDRKRKEEEERIRKEHQKLMEEEERRKLKYQQEMMIKQKQEEEERKRREQEEREEAERIRKGITKPIDIEMKMGDVQQNGVVLFDETLYKQMNLSHKLVKNGSLKCSTLGQYGCIKHVILKLEEEQTITNILLVMDRKINLKKTLVQMKTKGGLGEYGLDQKTVNTYLYRMIEWSIEQGDKQEYIETQFSVFVDSSYKQKWSDDKISELLNYVRQLGNSFEQLVFEWDDIRVYQEQENRLYYQQENENINTDYQDTDETNIQQKGMNISQFNGLIKNNCVNECSNQGICFNKQCYCYQNYGGNDCGSYDENHFRLKKVIKTMNSSRIFNPCYPKQFKNKQFIGIGNYKLCWKIIEQNYFDDQCAVQNQICYKNYLNPSVNLTNSVYIQAGNRLQKLVDIFELQKIRLRQLQQMSKNYCEMEMNDIREKFKNVSQSDNEYGDRCLELIFEIQLLKKAGLNDNTIINFEFNYDYELIKTSKDQIKNQLNKKTVNKKVQRFSNIFLIMFMIISIIIYMLIRTKSVQQKIGELLDEYFNWENIENNKNAKISEDSVIYQAYQQDEQNQNDTIENLNGSNNESIQPQTLKERIWNEKMLKQKELSQKVYVIIPLQVVNLGMIVLGSYEVIQILGEQVSSVSMFYGINVLIYLVVGIGLVDTFVMIIESMEVMQLFNANQINHNDIQMFQQVFDNDKVNQDGIDNIEPILMKFYPLKYKKYK